MKQLVLRLLTPECRVYSVNYGEIKDGQFVPVDIDQAPIEVAESVVVSEVLGSSGYIPKACVAAFIRSLGDKFGSIELFPNFLVIGIYESSEKEDAQ